MLTQFQQIEVMEGYEVTPDRFEVSRGLDLTDNTSYLNLEIISPEDPTDRILLSFTRAAVYILLEQMEDRAAEIWGDEEDDDE